MDRLRSLEVLVAIVERGSFVAASQLLDMSTVMVSKHIIALEKQVGAKLLNRTTRSVSLTEIGANYYRQARQIVELYQAANQASEHMQSQVRGVLRVSAPMAFGSECLAPVLPDYLKAFPDVQVELDLSTRNVHLIEDGYDAVIWIGNLPDSSMIARPLQTYGTAICASPDYLNQFGMPNTPQDLRQHRLLDYAHWTSQTRWRFEPAVTGLPVSCLRSNSGAVLKRAALAGVGILMQAEVLLREEISDGRLVPVLREFWPAARPMHLVYLRDRQHSQKLQSFVDFVLERFRLA